MPRRKGWHLNKPTSGGGGGFDLPPIQQLLDGDVGCGTYRKVHNSIATEGLDLPLLRKTNPPGMGPEQAPPEPVEPPTTASGPSNVFK
ncbi:hypothetical protein PG985_005340 [Apiospora marii]|uniref:Uncharacterized protein n=1 Tax=Apiospora marii TaxID=335849 RepID=A0ABR1SDI1_9PEZI